MSRFLTTLLYLPLLGMLSVALHAHEAGPVTVDLWPGTPPGGVPDLPPEQDTSEPGERLIAGEPLIRLGNVTHPQITIYRPDPAIDTGTAVIIAPGGGHWILAYDLEGTEVAEWLNSIGVTGIVLKYRVPGRAWNEEKKWEAAVQDAQRAVSLVRGRSKEFGIDPDKIGIMGFSAGAQAASFTTFLDRRIYEPVDDWDERSCRPNFVGMIYAGGYFDADAYPPQPDWPPFFITITHDDSDRSINSAELYIALKKAEVPAELHIFESGGHGYGLRKTYLPVTRWPLLMKAWLGQIGMLK